MELPGLLDARIMFIEGGKGMRLGVGLGAGAGAGGKGGEELGGGRVDFVAELDIY